MSIPLHIRPQYVGEGKLPVVPENVMYRVVMAQMQSGEVMPVLCNAKGQFYRLDMLLSAAPSLTASRLDVVCWWHTPAPVTAQTEREWFAGTFVQQQLAYCSQLGYALVKANNDTYFWLHYAPDGKRSFDSPPYPSFDAAMDAAYAHWQAAGCP